MINDDSLVRRDACPVALHPDIVDERKCEEYAYKTKSWPTCWCWSAFLVSAILSTFLGAGIALCFRRKGAFPSVPAGAAPMNVSDSGDNNCVVDDVFFQCTRQKTGLVTHVPECIVDVYNVYKEYWVNTVDPLFPYEPEFCSPENIALMVVASYANNLKHVEDRDLKTIYVLTTFFFALNGYDWFSSDSWLSYGPLSSWHGIRINEKGDVVSIALPDNHISGALPRQLAYLESLEYVDLSNNFIEGPLCDEVGNLQVIQLDHNSLTGTIPSSWGTSTQLQTIHLGFNKLTGTLSPGFGDMHLLQELSIPTNYINSTIPTEIGECSSLQVLDLRNNRLEGYLPEQISELSQLRLLDLSGNSFEEDHLPAKIFQLTKLERLHLSGCKLTGTVPPVVGNIVNLTILELGMNKLGGRLPSELGKLAGLTNMDFELNKLTGTVPSQLGELTSLKLMDLSRNKLTGSLPSSFGQLVELKSLLFIGNNFDGTIPDEVCDLWDDGELQELGLRYRSSPSSCSHDAFGGAACPNEQCCRNCPKLAPPN